MSRSKTTVSRTDKFPNFMAGTVIQSGVDTATTSQFSTPIPRLQTKGNKATVMELLSIEIFHDTTFDAAGEKLQVAFFGGTTTTTFTDVKINNPRVIATYGIESQFVTSGMFLDYQNATIQLQSTDGFGYLFASDQINVLVSSGSTGVANTVDWRIYYRFVDIPITEFVGLVQSQQQSTS